MGAWGTGIFEDDTALDTLDEFREANALEFIESAFRQSVETEYLEYEQCFEVLISGVVIDYILNGVNFLNDDENEYAEWLEGLQNLKVENLKVNAVKALQLVISDKSELNELWSESEEDYNDWKDNITSIIKRII